MTDQEKQQAQEIEQIEQIERIKRKERIPGQKWTEADSVINAVINQIELSKEHSNNISDEKNYDATIHKLCRAEKITKKYHKEGIITDKQAERLKTEIINEWQQRKKEAKAKGITLKDKTLDKLTPQKETQQTKPEMREQTEKQQSTGQGVNLFRIPPEIRQHVEALFNTGNYTPTQANDLTR